MTRLFRLVSCLLLPAALVACDARLKPAPPQPACVRNADCATGLVCTSLGSCDVQCRSDADCNGGACSSGVCLGACPPGQLACSGQCLDPLTDRAHCGATAGCTGPSAGVACPSGEVCAAGACATSCPSGQVACGGTCVSPLTDRAHCGASGDCTGASAGAACGSGQECAAGS